MLISSLKHPTPILKSVERDPFEETGLDPEPDVLIVPDKSFSNPAKMADNFHKHKGEDLWTHTPRHMEPKKNNHKEYGKFFLGIPTDTVKHTFEDMT